MSGKICPLMSKAGPWGWPTAEQCFTEAEIDKGKVSKVMCLEGDCQMWESQTGTCGLVTGGILAGRAAVTAEMRGDRGE